MKHLKPDQLNELEEWLQKFECNRPTRKYYRDFSDCTLFVKLLINFYPKLVDLNNYPPRNSVALKLNNWETLNSKILRKIDFTQPSKVLRNIAGAVPGYVEKLLFQFMINEKIRAKEILNNRNSETDVEEYVGDNNDIMMVNVNKQIGNAIVQMSQKMILYSIYDTLHNELNDKNQLIDKLQKRIEHLEQRILLKDERLEDLSKSISFQSFRKCIYNDKNMANKSSPCILDCK